MEPVRTGALARLNGPSSDRRRRHRIHGWALLSKVENQITYEKEGVSLALLRKRLVVRDLYSTNKTGVALPENHAAPSPIAKKRRKILY